MENVFGSSKPYIEKIIFVTDKEVSDEAHFQLSMSRNSRVNDSEELSNKNKLIF